MSVCSLRTLNKLSGTPLRTAYQYVEQVEMDDNLEMKDKMVVLINLQQVERSIINKLKNAKKHMRMLG